MGNANYSLNLDNIIEYFSYGTPGGKYLHYWLGLSDTRAEEVATKAYDIVWDAIEGTEEFSTIGVIIQLFKAAKEANYNDAELTYYLYFGFGEIESYLNPAIEVSFEPEQPDEDDLFIN